MKEDDASETEGEEEESDDDDDAANANGERIYSSKEDREELLSKLTEMTGGKVVAASTMNEILNADKGKRLTKSVRNHFEFRIAPGVEVEARSALLMSAVTFSGVFGSTIQKAVAIDPETNEPMLDDDGNEILEKIITKTSFVEDDKQDVYYENDDVIYAPQYGSSLVPFSDFDREGLKPAEGKVFLQILGYMNRDNVPSIYTSGDPYVVSGADSRKACAAISALAQALDRQGKVAVGTFLKRRSATQKNLVALYPLPEPDYPHPMRLVILNIPYGDEVKHLALSSLDELLHCDQEELKAKVCDDFIDALMLPDDILGSGKIPSPLVRSSNQTKLARAMDPKAEVVKVRPSDDDRMVTPKEVLKRAESAIQAFEQTFPLEPTKKDGKDAQKGRNGKKIITYKDYL